MPFPPTPTNVWDITQPPDSQLANLLGLDIRNLKNDIMQRLSLLSGTLANRPTPETVNATWGGTGFGLIYFATDVGIIYQWNGSAWVSTGGVGTLRLADVTQYTSNLGVATPTPGLVIPSYQVGSHCHIDWWGGATGSSQFNIQIGGSSFATFVQAPGGSTNYQVTLDLVFTSASAANGKMWGVTSSITTTANPVFISAGPTTGIFSAPLTINSIITSNPSGTMSQNAQLLKFYY